MCWCSESGAVTVFWLLPFVGVYLFVPYVVRAITVNVHKTCMSIVFVECGYVSKCVVRVLSRG